MPSDPLRQATIKAVCVSAKSIYRIEADGRPIAMAIAFGNGTWGLFDVEGEEALSPLRYRTPQMAATAAKRLGMHT